MKKTKSIFAIFAMSALAAICGFAQTTVTTEKPANPKYDAELAKKVGADKMGMRQYVLAILKTGPKDAEIQGEERSKLFKGHFDNMGRLAAEGKLAVAGPFSDPEKKYRGLFILAVKTVEEAKALAETDPTVKAGVLIVEYVPWYGSAALMLNGEFHDKVAKENF
jgi:uncharacterized protein YciI